MYSYIICSRDSTIQSIQLHQFYYSIIIWTLLHIMYTSLNLHCINAIIGNCSRDAYIQGTVLSFLNFGFTVGEWSFSPFFSTSLPFNIQVNGYIQKSLSSVESRFCIFLFRRFEEWKPSPYPSCPLTYSSFPVYKFTLGAQEETEFDRNHSALQLQ